MAQTYLRAQVFDTNGRPSTMRWRVTDAAAPTGYQTYANGVLAAVFGAGLPSLGQVKNAFVEIDLGVTPIDSAGPCVINNNWQTSWTPSTEEDFKLSIPARNPTSDLITPGTVVGGSIDDDVWLAVIAAFITTGIKIESTDGGDAATGLAKAIASTRGRKRPRVGGVR